LRGFWLRIWFRERNLKLRLKEEGENSSGILNNSLEYIRSLAIQMWSLEWCMGPGASSCCEVDN